MNQLISNLRKSHSFDFSSISAEQRSQFWEVLSLSVRGTDVLLDFDEQRLSIPTCQDGSAGMEIAFSDSHFPPSLAGAVDSGAVITTVCDGVVSCNQPERIAKSFMVLDPEDNVLVLRTAWNESWPSNLRDFELLHCTETVSEGVMYLVAGADYITGTVGVPPRFAKPTAAVVRAIVNGKANPSMAVMQVDDCIYTFRDTCKLRVRRVHFSDAATSRGEVTRSITHLLSGGLCPSFTVQMDLHGEHAVLNWTWLRNLSTSLSTICSDWRTFDYTSHIRLETAVMPTDQLCAAHAALTADTHRDGCRKLEHLVGIANCGLKLVQEALGHIIEERCKSFQDDAMARSVRLMPLHRTEYPVVVTEAGPEGEQPIGRLASTAAYSLYKAAIASSQRPEPRSLASRTPA